MHAIAAASALILTAGSAWAQAAGEASAMPECTGPCTYSHQVIGDTVTPVDSSSSYQCPSRRGRWLHYRDGRVERVGETA